MSGDGISGISVVLHPDTLQSAVKLEIPSMCTDEHEDSIAHPNQLCRNTKTTGLVWKLTS